MEEFPGVDVVDIHESWGRGDLSPGSMGRVYKAVRFPTQSKWRSAGRSLVKKKLSCQEMPVCRIINIPKSKSISPQEKHSTDFVEDA